jgi:hypothetical protein
MIHLAAAPPSDRTFRPATVLWALGASVVAALAFIVISTFAPELREDRDAGSNAASRSAVGYAGLVRLLHDTGVPTTIRRGPAPPGARGGLLILTPRAGADADEVDTASKYDGNVLIVAPKWLTSRSNSHRGWVVVRGLLPTVFAADALGRPEVRDLKRTDGARPVTLVAGPNQHIAAPQTVLPFGRIDALQHEMTDFGVPILVDRDQEAVLVGVGAGRIFLLTDPDLIDNHGMADPVTARSALTLIDILRGPNGAVTFDVTLDGLARPRSLMRIALTPPFFAATLCALAAFVLIGWRALIRFGPTVRPERAVALGKLALVESAAGLIRLAKRQARMAPRYAAVARGAAARAVGASRDWNAQQTDDYLDRLGDPSGRTRPFSDLVAAAERGGGSEAELMASAHDLFQWKLEVTRERR